MLALERSLLCTVTWAIAVLQVAHALFEPPIITFEAADDSLDITRPLIVVDLDDHAGLHIAANAVADDFERVTGERAQTTNATADDLPSADNGTAVILVGALDSSSIISALVSSEKLNTSTIAGQWESFIVAVVDEPFDGVSRALVIAGSDKRGAIFGLYTLSEQMGVSPWYWWTDIVPKHHDAVYAIPTSTTFGKPSVRYRGIFINDESPALNTWVMDNFGPKYNSAFYAHVFELLLRMKANYLWPAMWPGYPNPGNSFFVDDPLNQATADAYGIVVSTSHHEPMQRATNEWLTSGNGTWDWTTNKDNVTTFFEAGAARAQGYESYFTMGMRGDSDGPLSGDDPMAILTDVIATQRSIIANMYGNETAVKQVWALYKEVQEVYEQGLEVPDDMTLLLSDDNFGNIRRLPTDDEHKREGGLGIYYHCEFVGDPRSYKWLNANSLGKAQQQLANAHSRGADRIWVINVADIKPMETPLSMIMAMAYNISSVTRDTIPQWLNAYAARELPEEHADEAGDLLLAYSRLMGVRKHEHIEGSTFSLLNYDEADRILNAWSTLVDRAEAVYAQLDDAHQLSFYQLLLHPIKASYIYNAVRVAQAKNSWYGQQRRTSANDWAGTALDYFGQDYDLQMEWNAMLDGKWAEIMRQTHYGYTSSWRAPIRDMITGLSYVQLRQDSYPAVGQMGVVVEGAIEPYVGLFNEGSDVAKPSRDDLVPVVTFVTTSPYGVSSQWFEVYGRGGGDVHWTASTEHPWVSLSSAEGDLSASSGWDTRIDVQVDWHAVPDGFNDTSLIYINGSDGSYEEVHLPVIKLAVPDDFSGFVEGGGYVSIEAAHYTSSSDPSSFIEYPYLSRIFNGSGTVGLDASVGRNLAIPDVAPSLEYAYYQFSDIADNVTVTMYFTMAIDTDPDEPFMWALSLDGSTPNATRLMPEPASAGELPDGWGDAVQDQVWTREQSFNSSAGAHVLEYWANGPAVLLEKIVIDMGGVKDSYLGPRESMLV
ncbi:hypothetical protein BD626DRAFT_571342 [Schizophyllum amplum]|uniref:Gylcosyl hydrolase 115 C-terminal domain-containing protein n=1 Tax=Schizophyllum amplum TaxID=97359 RepID=A0A550C820_9AGAR|nr:hypothetical protein BD626DRAFT_571342 [Auriculariopsis ampla]